MTLAQKLTSAPILSEAQVDVYAMRPLIQQQIIDAMLAHPVVKTIISAGIIPFANDGGIVNQGQFNVPQIEITDSAEVLTIPAYAITVGSNGEPGPAEVSFLRSDALIGFVAQASVFNTDFPSSRVKIEYFNEDSDRIYMAEFDTSNIASNCAIAIPYLRQVERLEIQNGAVSVSSPSNTSFSALDDEVMLACGGSEAMNIKLTAENAVLRIKPVPTTMETLAKVVGASDSTTLEALVATMINAF